EQGMELMREGRENVEEKDPMTQTHRFYISSFITTTFRSSSTSLDTSSNPPKSTKPIPSTTTLTSKDPCYRSPHIT
ncbi:unnamed protein product, partial [Dovyalis caffra]